MTYPQYNGWFTGLGCSPFPGQATVYAGYTTIPGGSVVPTVVNLIEAAQSPTPGMPPLVRLEKEKELIVPPSGDRMQRQLRLRQQRQRQRRRQRERQRRRRQRQHDQREQQHPRLRRGERVGAERAGVDGQRREAGGSGARRGAGGGGGGGGVDGGLMRSA